MIGLIETWLEERGWEKVEGKLPKEYVWRKQWAKRRSKKGRACGGMLFGVRKGMEVRDEERWRGEGKDDDKKDKDRGGDLKGRIGVYAEGQG